MQLNWDDYLFCHFIYCMFFLKHKSMYCSYKNLWMAAFFFKLDIYIVCYHGYQFINENCMYPSIGNQNLKRKFKHTYAFDKVLLQAVQVYGRLITYPGAHQDVTTHKAPLGFWGWMPRNMQANRPHMLNFFFF